MMMTFGDFACAVTQQSEYNKNNRKYFIERDVL